MRFFQQIIGTSTWSPSFSPIVFMELSSPLQSNHRLPSLIISFGTRTRKEHSLLNMLFLSNNQVFLQSLAIGQISPRFGRTTTIKKIILFLWQCMLNRLPHHFFLHRRNLLNSNIFHICGLGVEDSKNILRSCTKGKDLWMNAMESLPQNLHFLLTNSRSFEILLHRVVKYFAFKTSLGYHFFI